MSAEPGRPARLRIEPLSERHDRMAFSCGVEPLDRTFKTQARQDVRRRIASCFVLTDEPVATPLGFYTLAAASVLLSSVTVPARTRSRNSCGAPRQSNPDTRTLVSTTVRTTAALGTNRLHFGVDLLEAHRRNACSRDTIRHGEEPIRCLPAPERVRQQSIQRLRRQEAGFSRNLGRRVRQLDVDGRHIMSPPVSNVNVAPKPNSSVLYRLWTIKAAGRSLGPPPPQRAGIWYAINETSAAA